MLKNITLAFIVSVCLLGCNGDDFVYGTPTNNIKFDHLAIFKDGYTPHDILHMTKDEQLSLRVFGCYNFDKSYQELAPSAVDWATDESSKATVKDGVVKAINTGEVSIVASLNQGAYSISSNSAYIAVDGTSNGSEPRVPDSEICGFGVTK